jgi:hypothetical protein
MSDMKLIMEGWRSYCTEPVTTGAGFDILYENYSKGRISHIQLYESWDRQVMTEAQALLDEGVLDVLKRGAQAIADGAKEEWEIIKFAYNEAAKKVSDFIFNIEIQAWKLIQDGKIILSKIAATLMKGVKFIKKFCGVQPVLCKATFALIVMISITAVMALMASPAMADVTMPADDGGASYKITDTGVKAIKGCLEIISRDADPEGQQLAVDAVRWLDTAHTATTSTDLSQLASEAQAQVLGCYQTVEKAAAEDPGIVSQLANYGEKIRILANKYYKVINGVTIDNIEWESLVEPGKGNVSPLAPQNIGNTAADMFDALK